MYASVQEYYGRVLQSTSDLKTSACCTLEKPPSVIRDIVNTIPKEINDKYYGCGTPIPFGIEGLNVLDLGSGSGRDCYVASALTGASGSVVGIDMTEQQLEVAKRHIPEYMHSLGYEAPNLKFVEGYIEFLSDAGIADNSMDLVISNCVVNLSPDKPRVLEGVYKALKPGGEFYFSDVYCNRRLPEHVREHEVLFGECLGGALYIEDFHRLCGRVGFTDPRRLSMSVIEVTDEALSELVGEAKFYSITYRCFKLPDRLESLCEDYGQVAVYQGTIAQHSSSYVLDDHHVFETNLPMRVCGNTASMVEESWLGKHFKVYGNRDTHYGLFDCGDAPAAPAAPTASSCC